MVRSGVDAGLVGVVGVGLVGAGLWVGIIGLGTSYELMQGPQGFGMYEVREIYPGAGIALGLSGLALIGYGLVSRGMETPTRIITIDDTHDN